MTPRVSFADLQRMPDDGNRYELYDGELRVVPSPLPWHQIVSGRLYEAFVEHRRRHRGIVLFAPLDIVLSDYNVVQPDIVYFSHESALTLKPREYIRLPPDLVVEVISPATARIDRGRKRDLFARHRVPEYWVVDPERRQIEVSILQARGYEEARVVHSGWCESVTQPGLGVDVNALFAEMS